ncbi:MAG TPA: DUF302 domain-containing protein [Anaerolineae bacterium]|nr:DUF302 domain-containing protein [Anaerolineae bacterium]
MTIRYGFRTPLDVPFETALDKTIAALKEEGFGVLAQIDMSGTLKKKLDVDFPRYTVLAACNPPLAHRALQTEIDIGLLIPCNVAVYEVGEGKSVVSIIDPATIIDVVGHNNLDDVVTEVKARLLNVAQALRAG